MQKRFWPFLITMAALVAAPAQARLYKWTDEAGQVHYGDSVPAKYLKKEHKEMNEQGLAVKKVDAAETEEQRTERLRLEDLAKEKEKHEEEQRQRDRVLLDTYTTERDLVAARDARFEAVDSQIQLSESIMDDSRKKLAASEKLQQSLKAQGKKIPDTLYDKIEREQRQLATQEDVKRSQLEQRQAIADQFNGYIERFRELKAEQQKRREELETQPAR
jgi:hypothetical protein